MSKRDLAVSLLFINVVPGAALGLLALYLNPTWPVWLGLVVVPGAVVLYVATIGRVVSRMVGATIAPILRARSDRWDS